MSLAGQMNALAPRWSDVRFFPSLKERAVTLQEFMDDPDCSRVHLFRTISQFKHVNVLTGAYRRVIRHTLLRDMQRDPSRAYHLVDLGAGGCDAAVWLLDEAAKAGVALRVTAIDSNPEIVEWATRAHAKVEGLTVVCGDMFDLVNYGDIDYAFSNHVLHHLDDESIVNLFDELHNRVRRIYVMSDIHRSYVAYWSFLFLAGLIFHRSFILADGGLSIRRSFKAHELEERVNLSNAYKTTTVQSRFPWRLFVIGGPFAAFGEKR